VLRATRAHLAGSIRAVLPAAFLSVQELTSLAGGFAAAIAVGAFIGQAVTAFRPATAMERRRFIAIGGAAGLLAMSGLIFLSVNGW
jgi:hypothetical protein